MANKTKFSPPTSIDKAYREDPLAPQTLTRKAVMDEITHDKLDEVKDAIAGVASGTVLNIFNEISAVATSTESTIVSYTVPAGQTLTLQQIEGSGENKSTYRVYIASSKEASKRSYFTNYNILFDFNNLELPAGTVLELKVEHDRTQTSDYEGRIIGVLS